MAKSHARAALLVAAALLAAAPAAAQPRGPGGLVAASSDLQPIPSRITHGVVSVRNTGTAASGPSIATVNCHLPNRRGGCPEIPARLVGAYENPAYPNRLVVNIPAIPASHVHSHNLTFWDAMVWPSGTYVFEFVVDAGATVGESNEGNNAGSYIWVVP
jgi:hypothetical protein